MMFKEVTDVLTQNTNKMLTVLILAAGYGKRMGPFSRMVNKSLIPYDNKPLISHIIDKFSSDTKFVITCGHLGQQIKDYVSAVHNEKNIVFVDIPDFSEGNTGPATTIQYCSEHIHGPFFWLSCDTLVDFDPTINLDHNWIGINKVNSDIAQDYCWVECNGGEITRINNKNPSKTDVDAFIGLMYCVDDTYIKNLKAVNAKEAYEGFDSNLQLKAHTLKNWRDFGTYEKWVELSRDLKEVSFPKPDEIFYSDNGKIIKFTTDSALAEKKYNRAKLNEIVMPNNVVRKGQFLVYSYVDGDIIYSQLTTGLLKNLLDWAGTDLWKTSQSGDTKAICEDFYYKKTISRLSKFRTKYPNWTDPHTVNGVKVKPINQYLDMIDWEMMFSITKWVFVHGDFQFENIIFNPINKKFTCIDWRTDFGGDMYGDAYYDLGKMLGGIFLDYQAVKADKLVYKEESQHVTLNDCGIPNAEIYADIVKEYCNKNELNWDKVKLLVPIIYLNMSPLHEAPFDKYLFALSQLYFEKYFNESANSYKQQD